jgi:hypothetical protein
MRTSMPARADEVYQTIISREGCNQQFNVLILLGNWSGLVRKIL